MRAYNTIRGQAFTLLELHNLRLQFVIIGIVNSRRMIMTVQAYQLLIQPLNDGPMAARLHGRIVIGWFLPQ